jgi:transketolase
MSDEPTAGARIMGIREDYQSLMEKQLNEWKAQAETLKASAEKFESSAKAQYEKMLETLRASQTQAWENFSKLKGSNDTAWAEFKAHMDKAGAEVRAAVESLTTNLKH